ncbi:MAG: ATP-dependent 6-phosphofructokinase [Bacteroidia bacterium]|nr:ATP-dependent 6-phosphofructokinase [Bacteroidia bacterium]
MKKKLLVLTGGGDCPGLNAVIRAIERRSRQADDWEVYGCIDAFNGLLKGKPYNIVPLSDGRTSGIHVTGGTILGTTNKGGPFNFPVIKEDGSVELTDMSDVLIERLSELGFEAVISIGGDGSQEISRKLHEKGVKIIGVPKTIDNDLSATDMTFGYQTAVQIATESLDRLVTTAASHSRTLIMEVMGRDAGWIALSTAIAGGAEICLIPEIPYDIQVVKEKVESRYIDGRGFCNIVIAEGAKPKDGTVVSHESDEAGYRNKRLGGVGFALQEELKSCGCQVATRVTVLGHTQRGGIPIAFDRVLATQFGVKAFEMVLEGKFGRMAAYRNNTIIDVSLAEATASYNHVDANSYLLTTARGMGMCLGD